MSIHYINHNDSLNWTFKDNLFILNLALLNLFNYFAFVILNQVVENDVPIV